MSEVGGVGFVPAAAPTEVDTQQQQFQTVIVNLLAVINEENVNLPGAPVNRNIPALDAPTYGQDSDNLALLLMELRNKVGELQLKNSKEQIAHDSEKTQSNHEKQIEKIEEFIRKVNEAKKKSKFGKIFGWVATIATVVAAVAAVVATGGAAAPLVAAAAITLTMQILDETGVMADLAEKNKDAYLGVMIGAAALTLILGVGGGIAAFKAADTASKAALIATRVQVGMEVAGAGASVGQGVTTIQATEAQAEAQQARADKLEFQRLLKKLQASLEDEMERLDEVIRQLEEGNAIIMDLLNASSETSLKIIRQKV